MAHKLTQDEFVQKASLKNPKVEILGEYTSSHDRIKVRCRQCGNIWDPCASSIISGNGCRKCADKKLSKEKSISKEEFMRKLDNRFANTIEMIGVYTGYTKPMTYRCKICNHQWTIKSAHSILVTEGCARCNHNISVFDHESFVDKVNEHGVVTVIGKFKNMSSNVLVRCNTCGHEFEGNAYILSRGSGCKQCANQKLQKDRMKSHDDFVQDVSKLNKTIKIVSRYQGAFKPVRCECTICGDNWETSAHCILNGSACPKCSKSRGEHKISAVLDENNISYTQGYTFDDLRGVGDGLLSYDFYIQSINCLIEFQGVQHYQPVKRFGGTDKFEIQVEHDKRKREYAFNHGYTLVEIRYDDDIDKKLKDIIRLVSVETTGGLQQYES